MMRQMRENTKWIMLLTAAAFVGLMIFQWGMDASGRSSSQYSGGKLGSVNGEAITLQEFNNVYQNLYQQQDQQQDGSISSSQNREIEDAAWRQLVSEKLIAQELHRRGIGVTPAEIKEAARFSPPPEFLSNPVFQTNGQFDIDKYHRFLASPAVDDRLLLQLEQYYREAIPRSKLFRQVATGVYVPDGELWRLYRDRNEKVRVEFVEIDPQHVVSDAEAPVTDAEVRQYYDAHRDSLQRPARVQVRVLSLSKAPLASDTAAVREHARQLHDEIAGGAAFDDVARREASEGGQSADTAAAIAVRRGQTPFDSILFTVPVGHVSEPVETPAGIQIFEIESRSGDQAEVRRIVVPIERQNDSETALLTRADSLEAVGTTSGFAEAARALGLQSRELKMSEGTPYLPGVGDAQEGADWAFGDVAVGETSPVFENESDYYMLELVDRQPAGTMSFDEVKDALRQRVQAQKKMAIARNAARDLVDEVHGGLSLAEAAKKHGLSTQEAGPFSRLDFVPDLGSTNAVIGTAFGLDLNEVSTPVESDDKLFVVRLVDRIQADRKAFEAQKGDQRQRVTAALEQSRVTLFLNDLRERAKIVDDHVAALHASRAAPSST